MEKFVTIYRRELSTKMPIEIKDEAKMKLSSGLTISGTTLKGISISEEEKLLPQIVDLPSTHFEFAKKVNTWYNNLSKTVPKLGLKLNIGVSEEGHPELIIDYLVYKRALVDKLVAKSKTEMLQDQKYRFYINDENEEKDKKVKLLKIKQDAQKEYFKIKENDTLVEWILQVYAQSLGERTTKYSLLSEIDKDLMLDKMVTEKPALFLSLAQDKDLELKAEILSMVDYQILTKGGNNYINGTEPIGETIEETIAYFKAAKNQTTYVQLKGKLEAFGYKVKKETKTK